MECSPKGQNCADGAEKVTSGSNRRRLDLPCALACDYGRRNSRAAGSRNGFQPIAQGVEISSLQTAFLTLAFPGFDQVLQTPRSLNRRLTAFGASLVPLHAQLILPLPRYGQVRVLVLNSPSHFLFQFFSWWRLFFVSVPQTLIDGCLTIVLPDISPGSGHCQDRE